MPVFDPNATRASAIERASAICIERALQAALRDKQFDELANENRPGHERGERQTDHYRLRPMMSADMNIDQGDNSCGTCIDDFERATVGGSDRSESEGACAAGATAGSEPRAVGVEQVQGSKQERQGPARICWARTQAVGTALRVKAMANTMATTARIRKDLLLIPRPNSGSDCDRCRSI